MKILIISPTSSGIGGISGVVQNQIKFLKDKGHEVDVISSENTLIIPIKGLKNPSFIVSSFFKTLFKKNYDIVHAHNPASGFAMKNISGKKVISIWGLFENQIELLHGKTMGKLSGLVEKNILKHADVVIVASKEIQTNYLELGYETRYIPNGIDLESLSKEEERLYEKQLIFVGRLSKEKGILDLLQITEKLSKKINLIIIGIGPEEDKVKKISENFENVHYFGYLPKEKVIPLIRGSDILIQPSHVEGGLNSTLLEAMACKVPIICTLLPEYGDEIKHLETSYCVKPSSPNELLTAINQLIIDKQLQKNLSENAFNIAINHSWKNIGEELILLYEKLLNR